MMETGKKDNRRKHNMRTTVMMAVVCVLLLSGATYAWFTLSSTAKVSNITLTVGEASGLQISRDNTNWTGNIALESPSSYVKLLPATMETGGIVKKPKYNDLSQVSEVIGLGTGDSLTFGEAKNVTENRNVYCFTQTFYLKTEQGTADMDIPVYLKKGMQGTDVITGGGFNSTNSLSGTYVVCTQKEKNKTTPLYASTAMRFCFASAYGGKTNYGIFEPNEDAKGTSANHAEMTQQLTTKLTPIKTTIKQKTDGTFPSDYADATNAHSKQLFTIKGGGVSNTIVMTVWLEGTDSQCVNEVGLDNLAAQFQFTLGGTDD